jgi:hypothetical protein
MYLSHNLSICVCIICCVHFPSFISLLSWTQFHSSTSSNSWHLKHLTFTVCDSSVLIMHLVPDGWLPRSSREEISAIVKCPGRDQIIININNELSHHAQRCHETRLGLLDRYVLKQSACVLLIRAGLYPAEPILCAPSLRIVAVHDVCYGSPVSGVVPVPFRAADVVVKAVSLSHLISMSSPMPKFFAWIDTLFVALWHCMVIDTCPLYVKIVPSGPGFSRYGSSSSR